VEFQVVAVKCVDIWRNISGEGDSLVNKLTLMFCESVERTGLDTLVVHNRKRCLLAVCGFNFRGSNAELRD